MNLTKCESDSHTQGTVTCDSSMKKNKINPLFFYIFFRYYYVAVAYYDSVKKYVDSINILAARRYTYGLFYSAWRYHEK